MRQASLLGIFFIKDWCGRAKPTLGDNSPGQVIMGWTKIQGDHIMRSTAESRISSWFLFQIWTWFPILSVMGYGTRIVRWTKTFLPSCIWSWCFITILLTLNKTLYFQTYSYFLRIMLGTKFYKKLLWLIFKSKSQCIYTEMNPSLNYMTSYVVPLY